MKTNVFFAIALAFCTSQSIAQIRIPGTVTSGLADGINIGGSSIVIGTSTSTASSNVIIGNGTGNLNTAGGNVFVGQAAATANTTGYANAFFGTWSGGANNQGYANTFLGHWSGPVNTTGAHNVFVGQGAGPVNTTGGDNSFMGQGAGWNNTTGYLNTFIGKAAGLNNTTGYNNTALGANTGFSSGNFTKATAIGAGAQAMGSNTMVLGGTGTNAVNVGIGTTTIPMAHLHTESPVSENILFSTVGTFSSSATTVNLSTGTGATDDMKMFMNHSNYGGSILPGIVANSAPVVPLADMGGLLTDGASLAIGMEGYELNKTGSIHFINYVGSNRTECMRINEANGFVGVHTRSATSAAGTGAPQALFHVNLTNPAGAINTSTQGIRFEGLPAKQSRHTEFVVIDPATGDLARGTGSGGGSETDPYSWHLTGNATSGSEWIGTTTTDDFRIGTNSTTRGRVTADGNFDFGGNITMPGTGTSTALGTTNTLDGTSSAFATGTSNTIKNSDYSATLGDGNTIQLSSVASQATGKDNTITDADYSMTAGDQNTIDQSTSVFAGGTSNQISSSQQVLVHGDYTIVENSYASGAIGEDNEMHNGHGTFIGGGHNYIDGWYNFTGGSRNITNGGHNIVGGHGNTATGHHNFLLGNYLVGDVASSTAVPADHTDTNPYLMIIGERINSDLPRSLSAGFNGNRTTVTTERGMSVQINPTSGSTDIPTVNFEVEAGVSTTGRQALSGFGVQSNIRFHNLPLDPQGRSLPAVLIDPNTGELFLSQNAYMKPGKSTGDAGLDSMYKENEALKNRVSQLESQLTMFDEKFAQLERSLNQICESGCAGLGNNNSDVLYQSIPNPADNSAKVNYYLARNYSDASIVVYGMDGREVGSYTLSPAKGDGTVNVVLGDVLPGTYLYRLIVDGKPVALKKMQKQ